MSLTYIGIIVSLLAGLAQLLGLKIGTEALTTTVETIALFVGAIIACYGRFRVGGISWHGGRVKNN